ncbi:MAG: succinate dehydrogenase, cytochrome b556 subunit [Alphaproteobacteria bacterium]|nr:succinate dehydrogenase, cytochrome b556 subunit [Alphaproteobacteria bacterium]
MSPHLQVYRPQLTSGISIFHRITAVGLTGGLVVLVAWLFCLAWLPEWYEPFTGLLLSPIGKIFLFGWTWAYFFHVGATIRHLLWDAVLCFSLKSIYLTGYMMLAISTALTFAFWIIALGQDFVPWL